MKKSNKKSTIEKLSLNKVSIARLNQMNAIKGGAFTKNGTTPIFAGKERAYENIESIGDPGSDFYPTNG
ncbi:class I lanthipeptide [uncultured Aquimarina sp.]|uniref:class I lanthipeptide n=1 Tax=uncultured Aquimarina sp. TaxID=575652 RepID=UPI002635F429|nr:class I lanthipeptide [uncultured Aquimarina sp.]